jgi:hypothetical protein
MLATAFKGLSLTSSSSLLGGRPCQAGTTHRPLPLQRSPVCPSIEAAHKKGGGSTKNGRCAYIFVRLRDEGHSFVREPSAVSHYAIGCQADTLVATRILCPLQKVQRI